MLIAMALSARTPVNAWPVNCEGVTIQNAAHAIHILERLRQFGGRVSIDDFGTGYSSLSCLHQLPFDTLKIDRSFVSGLQSKSDGGQIIQTILDLAKNLKLDVIAEGTESENHVDLLRELGCGYVSVWPRCRSGRHRSKPGCHL
jgi:EAL domain-containing protein (putative c-di-GMP-specific phosphodiesterase class I)